MFYLGYNLKKKKLFFCVHAKYISQSLWWSQASFQGSLMWDTYWLRSYCRMLLRFLNCLILLASFVQCVCVRARMYWEHFSGAIKEA